MVRVLGMAMALAALLAGCVSDSPPSGTGTPSPIAPPAVQLQSLVREFDLVVTGVAGPNPVSNRAVEPIEALMKNCVSLEKATEAGVKNVTARLTGTPNVPGEQVTLSAWVLFSDSSHDVQHEVNGTPPLTLEFDYQNYTFGKPEPILFAIWAFTPRDPAGVAVRDTYHLVLNVTLEDASALTFNDRGVCY